MNKDRFASMVLGIAGVILYALGSLYISFDYITRATTTARVISYTAAGHDYYSGRGGSGYIYYYNTNAEYTVDGKKYTIQDLSKKGISSTSKRINGIPQPDKTMEIHYKRNDPSDAWFYDKNNTDEARNNVLIFTIVGSFIASGLAYFLYKEN